MKLKTDGKKYGNDGIVYFNFSWCIGGFVDALDRQ
jgi:hypothetical protein